MSRARTAQPAGDVAPGDTDEAVLRRYYSERDYIASPDGIMKLVSVVVCIVLSVVLFSASCAHASLRVAGAALELACAAVLACLSAAGLLQLARHAPMGCLFADLILSTVIGILLLVTAALSLTLCDAVRATDYIHGVLGIANAGVVTGSAVVTYVSVTRRWDEARGPGPAPASAPPREQEV